MSGPTRLLPSDRWVRVETPPDARPAFVACAAYRRDPAAPGGWVCVEAAPIIRRWVAGVAPGVAAGAMRRKGWRWVWLPEIAD